MFNLLNAQQCNTVADKYCRNLSKQERPTKKADVINLIVDAHNKNFVNNKNKQGDKKVQSKISSFFKKITPSNTEPTSELDHYKNVTLQILKQLGNNEAVLCISEHHLELFKMINKIFSITHIKARGGNSNTIMVLADTIKKIHFPKYIVPSVEERKNFSFFDSREEFEEFKLAGELKSRFYSLLEEQNYEAAIKECVEPAALQLAQKTNLFKNKAQSKSHYFLLRYSAGWVYARIVDIGVRDILETKQKQYKQATQLLYLLLDSPFRIGSRGKWYERLALDYQQHLKQKSNAHTICVRALSSENEVLRLADRYTLEKRLSRLQDVSTPSPKLSLSKTTSSSQEQVRYKFQLIDQLKSFKEVYIRGHRESNGSSSKKSVFRSYCGKKRMNVEELALQYYLLAHNYQGIHCEGSLCATLFGLLCWDVIFDSNAAPYAFQSKYQDSPLDVYTDAFYVTRKELFDDLFNKMVNDQDGSFMTDLVRRVICENEGAQNKFVRWSKVNVMQMDDSFLESDEPSPAKSDSQSSGIIRRSDGVGSHNVDWLCDLIICLGGRTLSMVCRMFAEDYHYYRSGMPDLLLWNIDKKEAIFSEVKGPGDRLSDKQTIWIDLLNACNANVEVLHIVELDDEKSSNKFELPSMSGKKKKKKSDRSAFDDDDLRMLIKQGVITFPEPEISIEEYMVDQCVEETPKKNAVQILMEQSKVTKKEVICEDDDVVFVEEKISAFTKNETIIVD
ncbi:hypothetical protein AKO1_012823 [Acrasis kona]|uniref:Fanconi-associated nuclease n=1 Tax=Acrasis kona TaxID=1008807 RepID=A0AAW2YUY4_9EUKA